MSKAKKRLSKLVKKPAKGESLVIAGPGKPAAAFDTPNAKPVRRFGFMKGQIKSSMTSTQ